MPYLTEKSEILAIIAKYTQAKTLWMDTEVADYKSRTPRLSLIQVLDDPNDWIGDSIYLLDVLDQPDVVADFVNQIMMNPAVEKVFHNASYDLRYLGGKKAENVTCTLNMAKKIPYHILPLPNYQLKTLATKLCNFHDIDKQEQGSDWGRRPLSEEQIEYAYLDCIYLAQVHLRLLELQKQNSSNPIVEDLTRLAVRYTQVEQEWKLLNSEYEHLQERIKQAMQAQNLSETPYFKLDASERTTVKVPFTELVNLVQKEGINLDFAITLTKELQKCLGQNIEQLPIEMSKSSSLRLTSKNEEGDVE
jgi:ribonuclease D